MSDLLLRQQRFAFLFSDLVQWIKTEHPTWRITHGDGSVDPKRLFRAEDGRKFPAEDGVHMRGGCHYMRLAQDFNLFVNVRPEKPEGDFVTSSEHPAWVIIGRHWLEMDPEARWGGDWDRDGKPFEEGEHDANHVSVTFGGKA